MSVAALLDIDGTLVDSNYQHAIAWYRAFREHELTPPVWRIHRHIGVGGDQLVARVGGDEVEQRIGDAIRDSETRFYGELIGEVRPFEGARELIAELRERGHSPVLASSAKAEETDHYIELLDAGELIDSHTTSADVEARCGDAVRETEARMFAELIDEVRPLEGARELIAELKARGHTVVLASSAKREEAEHFLDLLEARELVDAWTTSADVDRAKPAPDLVSAAMGKAEGRSGVMVGDTTWDVEAASRPGLPTLCVLTGGFGEAELVAAGAAAVFESPATLCEALDSTPLC